MPILLFIFVFTTAQQQLQLVLQFYSRSTYCLTACLRAFPADVPVSLVPKLFANWILRCCLVTELDFFVYFVLLRAE